MERRKNYFAILDEQLERLYEYQKDNSPYSPHKIHPFIDNKAFIEKHKLHPSEFTQINQKLYDDGYLDYVHKNMNCPVITFSGLIFIQEGKYRNERRTEKWSKWLTVLNVVVLALGALAGGLYAGFEIWKYYYGYIPPPCP